MGNESEQHVLQQCSHFQQYALEQMLLCWISGQPDPELIMNQLIEGWRNRATSLYEGAAKARMEQTGLIDTGGEYFQSVLDEAERRVQTKLFAQVKPEEKAEQESVGRTM